MVLKLGHFESRSKYPETFHMWCWRRLEMIILTDRVRCVESRGKGTACIL